MHLTLHADYSFRVLIYLAANPSRLATTDEISRAYGISKHHLVRVVQHLGKSGFIKIQPGRSGGIALARDPIEISLGDVFRQSEPDFNLAECFDRERNTCPLTPSCGLMSILGEARDAFLSTLDTYTLADTVSSPTVRLLHDLTVRSGSAPET